MNNNGMDMIKAFMQFKNSFTGDPKQEVMKLMSSGRMSQNDLNRLQGMANQFMNLMNNKK